MTREEIIAESEKLFQRARDRREGCDKLRATIAQREQKIAELEQTLASSQTASQQYYAQLTANKEAAEQRIKELENTHSEAYAAGEAKIVGLLAAANKRNKEKQQRIGELEAQLAAQETALIAAKGWMQADIDALAEDTHIMADEEYRECERVFGLITTALRGEVGRR